MHRLHTSSEELLAFVLDGKSLLLATRQHLDRCPTCQRRMSWYQRTASGLVSWLYRSHCPSATALSYYCLPGALTDQERGWIAAHLALCPLCAREFAQTREFLEV